MLAVPLHLFLLSCPGWTALAGSIPKELGKLTALRELRLYCNQLSGKLFLSSPKRICALRALGFSSTICGSDDFLRERPSPASLPSVLYVLSFPISYVPFHFSFSLPVCHAPIASIHVLLYSHVFSPNICLFQVAFLPSSAASTASRS